MRILVIGTGSIGRRHIGNLVASGAEVSAFSHRGGRGAAPLPAGVHLWGNLDEAGAEVFDGVVVANRTDLHVDVALQFARAGSALLIEKPLSDRLAGVAVLQETARQRGLIVEAGFMLRFHPNLQWMHDHLGAGKLGKLYSIRAAVGQHLSQWRPGTDHRAGYSAKRAQGGGAVFDLVHELDAVRWLAGDVEDVVAMMAHEPSLEVETEAIAQIGLRCASGVLAQVHLDYLRPTYGRTLEIAGSSGVLSWDYLSGTVLLEQPGSEAAVVHRVPRTFERNDMFKAQTDHFLKRIRDHAIAAGSSLDDSVAVLRIALASHESANTRRAIRPDELGATFRLSPSAFPS